MFGISFEVPRLELVNSYMDALRAGPFTHMALGGFGDDTSDQIAKDPAAFIQKITSTRPRQVITPSGEIFILTSHSLRWVISDLGVFVGGVSIRADRNHPLLEEQCGHAGLSVRSDFQNQGFGKAIWLLILKHFKQIGFKTIVASADIHNAKSNHLIKLVGGIMIGRNRNFGLAEALLYSISTDYSTED